MVNELKYFNVFLKELIFAILGEWEETSKDCHQDVATPRSVTYTSYIMPTTGLQQHNAGTSG